MITITRLLGYERCVRASMVAEEISRYNIIRMIELLSPQVRERENQVKRTTKLGNLQCAR